MRRLLALLLLASLTACTHVPASRSPAAASLVAKGELTWSDAGRIVDGVIARLGPARNQRDTQVCFAYAVADVASFHIGQPVSAFSVAVRNFQFRHGLDYAFFNPVAGVTSDFSADSRYMLGLASSTLDSIREHSLCADDQPASELSFRDGNLKELWDTYEGKYRPYIGPRAPTHLYPAIVRNLMQIAPGLDAKDFMGNLSRYQPLDQALGAWMDRQCTLRMPAPAQVVGGEVHRWTGDQVIAALDDALRAGEPAVVHYDPAVLRAEDPSFVQKVLGFHVSDIVAKATIYGHDYYLLRNSWGTRCTYTRSVAVRCDRGHVWLTEDEVRSYVSAVAYLRY